MSDHHRKRYRTPQVTLHELIESREAGPDEVVEQILAQKDLQQAISTLTNEQQNVLAFRFGRDMSIHDVARILGKTEGAIKQLQARAIAALARKLSPGLVD